MRHIWGFAGSDRGLTLLEVLVALGIMAMAMAMVLPFGSRSGGAIEADTTAREIASSLRGARAAAIASNRPVDFVVDTQRGAFGYERLSRPRRDGSLRLALFTTDQMRAGSEAGSIRFFPDGSSTGGGVAVNSGTQRVVVMVDWLSGGVSVVRGPPARAS